MNSIEKAKQLQQLLKQKLLQLIDQDYVLYGLPYYSNIGDTLIWEGTIELLTKSPYKCRSVCGWSDYPQKKLPKELTILIEGGGYFGNVWRHGWEFVLNELSLNKNNKIIIMPNTIWYNDPKVLEKDQLLLSQMPNLTICARDKRSYDFAFQHFNNNVCLLPDLAFCMNMDYLSKWEKPVIRNCLFLKRGDKELVKSDNFEFMLPAKIDTSDWPTMLYPTYTQKTVEKIAYAYRHRLGGRLTKNEIATNLYNKMYYHIYRKEMSKQGIEFISRYRTIYTTRLHGMILAALLGKETYFFDNSYGKISDFYNTWLSDTDNINSITIK
jgi:pyruvyl transferase EpsO